MPAMSVSLNSTRRVALNSDVMWLAEGSGEAGRRSKRASPVSQRPEHTSPNLPEQKRRPNGRLL
jgi:hypothetical protein